MLSGNIADQFHNQYCLADACTAEETDFSAFGIRRNEVNNLDACFQNGSGGRLVFEARGRTVNRPVIGSCNRSWIFVDSFAKNVKNPSQCAFTNRHSNGSACVDCFHAASQSVSGAHGYAADSIVSQVLHDFRRKPDFHFA